MLDLRKAAGFTDYFLICLGHQPRQVRAIADAVMEALAAEGAKPAHVEGYDRSEWILLDYFDFIVHIFAPETRLFYGLERLWGNADGSRCRRALAIAQRAQLGATGYCADLRLLCSLRRPRRHSRRRPRAGLRRLRPSARTSDARPGLRRLLGVDPAADAAALRSLRRSAADVARDQRAAGALPALPSRAPRWSIARAPSAPTTARCARSSTRSKYEGRRSLARPLGAADARARRRRARGRGLRVPVPLHPSRRRQRGFNQAADLARHWACRSCRRCAASRATATQTGLPAAQRHRNVRDAFAAHARPRSLARRGRRAGRRCEHDRRDAGSVRAGAERGGQCAEVRALTAARVADVHRRADDTSAAIASFARSPSSTTQSVRGAPAAGSSRARAPASPGRARSDRDRPTCASPRSRARCRAGSSATAGGRNFCIVGRATPDRGPAPRRRRCSTRCSDRRRGSARRRASAAGPAFRS